MVRTLRHFELIPGPALPMSLAVPFADESIKMDALKKCAANGDDATQLDPALRYRDGNGVEKDHAEAMHRALRAADLESAEAAFNLGQFYCGAQANAVLSRHPLAIEIQ